MNNKAIFASAVLIMFAAICFVPVVDADSNGGSIKIDPVSEVTFDNSSGGNLKLYYTCTKDATIDIEIYNAGSNTPFYTFHAIEFKKTEGEQKNTVVIPLNKTKHSFSNGEILKIKGTNGEFEISQITVHINTSIFSNWTTYAAIAIVVILIIAFIAFKARMAPAKSKNQMTYEQLEAMKKAERESGEKADPVTTERKKYLSSRKK